MFLMSPIFKRSVVVSREAAIVANKSFRREEGFDVAVGVNGVVKIFKKAIQLI